MSASAQLLQWAVCLAELGWKVFPLQPGTKRPALHGRKSCPGTGVCGNGHQGWEQRATDDLDRVCRCWSIRPFNIGVATGPSDLVGIDLDLPKPIGVQSGRDRRGVRSGAEVFASRARREGAVVPATYTVTTPSGGTHLYFRAPAGVELRNTSGALGPLIDTRAHGGYLVAPGSITPEGAYELYDDTEPADLQGWLVQALASKPSAAISAPREIAAAKPAAYVSAALRDEAERVAAAKPGQQNSALYGAAKALGRLVAGGAVSDAQVRAVLHQAMSRLPDVRAHDPWTPAAIDATISSGFRASADRPRYLGTRAGRGVAV
ncbi:bifunctional DNA primase/polymerase [Saccharopolyspora shandongensis]|uniref:bifunctional DNA primase/polymerase n=1 Tax=Saccharopolyspora shandongensis TaxID=418495 RepID=UPI003429753D